MISRHIRDCLYPLVGIAIIRCRLAVLYRGLSTSPIVLPSPVDILQASIEYWRRFYARLGRLSSKAYWVLR